MTGARLAGKTAAVCATNPLGHGLGQGTVVNIGCTGQTQKLAEHGWVGVEAIGQHRVPEAFEATDLRVAGEQVVKRWLDQRQ